MRQKKREVKIGNVTIGGSNPIAVQTMLNVPVVTLPIFTSRFFCRIRVSLSYTVPVMSRRISL